MDVGRFYSATIWTPTEMTLKGIAVRVGEKQEASVLFDTELLRVTCGWTGEFLKFDPARFGIIGPPRIGDTPVFSSPRQPGWSRDGTWKDPRPKPFGPLPREWAKYRGLYQHGNRVVFKYTVGAKEVEVLESPWLETINGATFITRELEVAPSNETLELLVAATGVQVELIADAKQATLNRGDEKGPITATIAPHEKPISLKLLFPVGQVSNLPDQNNSKDRQVGNLPHEGLRRLATPGKVKWTAEITTRGVISNKLDALVVDTLTLPFDNPYKALMFVSGHDFFEDLPLIRDASPRQADAAICTLHGDVWLLNGMDDKLDKLTWKRFATGLFQPLGLKIVKNQIYVVGRDQITRLHDLNGDGEADWYENFNNDGQVTTNGHEYVTCLETDSNGWFYFLKGNAGGATDHDGCLLRVSPDGQNLEVFATGFRNANGLGVGQVSNLPGSSGQVENLPHGDIITVAPQEGEWTPASAIFQVRQGGFYGYVPSAHRADVPMDFTPPLCWIPRLQDNSSGGQVWVPNGSWGPLAGMPLHLSYGTSQMFLVLREPGATVPLPLSFESGVMRGRFRRADGHLYVSGLRGWVSNAAKVGCLQRVRYTGQPLDLPMSVASFQNGVLLKFTDWLDLEAAEDPDNYRVQRWNYHWSAAYGSPEFKVSNPAQEGRDDVEVLSATHVRNSDSGDAVFLELADMRPVNQLSIQMTLRNAIGQPLERRLDATINTVKRQEYAVKRKPSRIRPGTLTESEQQDLVPGIRCEFVGQVSNLPKVDDRQVENLPHVRRMAAWRFEPGEITRAGEITATGYVVAPQRGKYRILAECNSATEVSINDQVVWRSNDEKPAEVELVRGYNRLKAIQRVVDEQLGQPISFRLLWESAAFETEPVPPTSLFCVSERLPEQVVQAQRGRTVFVSYQCFRCHRVSDDVLNASTAMPELQAEAPDFIGAGSRLRSDWIYAWMLNPAMKKEHTRMPRLFPLDLTDEHFQDASDIAEYVGSLRDEELPRPKSADDLRQGKKLWEELGCIGCHQLTPQSTDLKQRSGELFFLRRSRIPQLDLKDKYHPAGLRTFLAKPHQHFAWNPMPDFQLAPHEVESLALLLEDTVSESRKHFTGRLKGDPVRGKKLFEQYRCGQCHRVATGQPLSPPYLPTVFGKEVANGCLSSLASDTKLDRVLKFPKYSFSNSSQTALVAALSKSEWTLASDSPTDISRRFVNQLRCQVCHARDGKSSWLPEVLAEESETGKPPEIVPNLTWAGEKLHSSWTANLLRGEMAERPRPWLRIRMPSFPAHARWLADGFAHEHGLSSEPESRPSVHPELVAIGEVLATRAGMLDCRQCHALGELPPTGDKNTLLAPGINFAQTRERMRFDFYRRFTLDPPRYEVTTRMPKLAANGRTTKITNVFDGDARRQFEAVWHFLQTIPSSTADP